MNKTQIYSTKLIDFHTHLYDRKNSKNANDEILLRMDHGIFSCYSCGSPEEWDFLNRTVYAELDSGNSASCMASFGIHPWNSDLYDPDKYEDIYSNVPIIGEIGMDSVWTDIPLDIQRTCFIKQLKAAEKMQKPVILHTKGCEKEIADILKKIPVRCCVHWYSGDIESLNRFIDMGCYFTIGPDFAFDDSLPVVKNILKRVPRNRIFTETDGLESIYWLQYTENEIYDVDLLESVLNSVTQKLAAYYSVTSGQLIGDMQESIKKFIE